MTSRNEPEDRGYGEEGRSAEEQDRAAEGGPATQDDVVEPDGPGGKQDREARTDDAPESAARREQLPPRHRSRDAQRD